MSSAVSSCVRYAATYDSHLLSGRYCVPSNETLKAVVYILYTQVLKTESIRRIPKDLSKPQADILAFSGPLGVERLWMPQTCLGSVQRLFSTVPQIQCKGTRALAVSRTCADLIFVNYTDAAFYVLCFVLYGRGDVYLQDCWLVVFFAVVVTVLVSLAYIFVLGSLKAEGIQLIHWNASANMCHPQLQRA